MLAVTVRTSLRVASPGLPARPHGAVPARPACAPAGRRLTTAALPGSDAIPIEGEAREELPQWLTLAGYAATALAAQAKVSSFQLTASHIYSALAWYTLAWGALTIADQARGSDAIGGTVGPIFLAVNALNGLGRIAPFEAATFLFGYLWLDKLPSFSQSRWVWGATLLAAIYKGYAAQWLVAAFGLSAAWKLVAQYRDTSTIQSPQQVAFVALAAWAFYKQVEMPVALTMMAAQMVASAVA